MGVRLLNKLLRQRNPEGIKEEHLSVLYNKVIVVDINIYIYKFSVDNKLIENLFLMCSLFRSYNIHPLFIFDGYKYNKNKEATLNKRRQEKFNARTSYDSIIEKTSKNKNPDVLLEKHLRFLKSKFIKVTKTDIENVKRLLDSYGMKYIIANGEADELCAALVLNKKAYACLTEDTDLFVYGCPLIMKYLSFKKHTALFYDVKKIHYNLAGNYNTFREIAILSGTDYNEPICNNIFKNLDLLEDFQKHSKSTNEHKIFLDWLIENNIINDNDKTIINDVKKKFTIDNKKVFENIPYKITRNGNFNKIELMNVLNENNFIFI